nr:PREDICTED: short-chain dehydrogenase/reductase family 16C member 6-like [Bemisia tabaci]
MSKQQRLPKDFTKLIFQSIWFLMAMIPMILWALIKEMLPSKKKSLKNEVILITGAGTGLGRELAERLAPTGCRLALVDINEAAVNEVADRINREHPKTAKAYATNLGVGAEIAALARRVLADFERVDILVNNAGIVIAGPRVWELEDREIDGIFQVNTISHFKMIREFLPGMLERNHGQVVAISSLASLTSVERSGPYTASKWAVTGMMHSLRDDLRRIPNNKVVVTNICPYYIYSGTGISTSNNWDLRIPPISVEEAADATINGIVTNKFEFTIPGHHYFWTLLLKFLPLSVRDWFYTIYYCRTSNVTEEQRTGWNSYKIIDRMANRLAEQQKELI